MSGSSFSSYFCHGFNDLFTACSVIQEIVEFPVFDVEPKGLAVVSMGLGFQGQERDCGIEGSGWWGVGPSGYPIRLDSPKQVLLA